MDNKKQYSNKDLRGIFSDFVQEYTVNTEYSSDSACEMFSPRGRMMTTIEIDDEDVEYFLYSIERAALPPTKMKTWQKSFKGSIFFATSKSDTGMIEGYGFTDSSEDFQKHGVTSWLDENLTEATNQEVAAALISYAKSLDLSTGKVFKSAKDDERILCSDEFVFDSETNELRTVNRNKKDNRFDCIFSGGKFASNTSLKLMKKGVWYVVNDGYLVCPTKDQTGQFEGINGYGFCKYGSYKNNSNSFYEGFVFDGDEQYVKASKSQVLKEMIKYCIDNGLVYGATVTCMSASGGLETINGHDYRLNGLEDGYTLTIESIRGNEKDEVVLFNDGNFTKVV